MASGSISTLSTAFSFTLHHRHSLLSNGYRWGMRCWWGIFGYSLVLSLGSAAFVNDIGHCLRLYQHVFLLLLFHVALSTNMASLSISPFSAPSSSMSHHPHSLLSMVRGQWGLFGCSPIQSIGNATFVSDIEILDFLRLYQFIFRRLLFYTAVDGVSSDFLRFSVWVTQRAYAT